MKYCTVTCHMSKGPRVMSDNHKCAERKLIRRLYVLCLKRGNKPHKFPNWLHRKFGELTISRKTAYGDGISIPCVLCRKCLEKYDIRWCAHDGRGWIHSKKSEYIPKSRPTRKQKDVLGFGDNVCRSIL